MASYWAWSMPSQVACTQREHSLHSTCSSNTTPGYTSTSPTVLHQHRTHHVLFSQAHQAGLRRCRRFGHRFLVLVLGPVTLLDQPLRFFAGSRRRFLSSDTFHNNRFVLQGGVVLLWSFHLHLIALHIVHDGKWVCLLNRSDDRH
jgi:hypothetical protein